MRGTEDRSAHFPIVSVTKQTAFQCQSVSLKKKKKYADVLSKFAAFFRFRLCYFQTSPRFIRKNQLKTESTEQCIIIIIVLYSL